MDCGPAASGRQLPSEGASRNDEEWSNEKKPAVISDGRPVFRHAASSAAVTPYNAYEVEWDEEA